MPRKNLQPLAGKPLLLWTIEAGQRSRVLDRMIISSDDAEIIDVARRAGCDAPFRRPDHLSTDQTPGIAPAIHAVEMLPGYDFLVLLQPTSPLRLAEDIDGAVAACVDAQVPAAVSVTEAHPGPEWMFRMQTDRRLSPVLETVVPTRRQDMPSAWALNGAVFVANCNWLANATSFIGPDTIGYPMPRERSIDIDTPLDFAICEAMLVGAERDSRRQVLDRRGGAEP